MERTQSTLREGDELAEAGAEAPRVTLAGMERRIYHEAIFNAHTAMTAMGLPAPDELRGLTIALVTLDNGWVLLGKSAPASLLNYDVDKGRIFARDDALRQLWPLEGYLLRERLAFGSVKGED